MVKREGMENLLLSYYEGETTEDETALVEEWLEASEENRRTARQVQTLGLAADMAQISSRLDVKKALEDVHRKMKQKKVNRYQVLFRGMQRAAAILFIPLMVSWSILYWDKDKEEIHMMEVRTNPGMTTSVELPDGTEVVLNSSSSLRYPSRFADDKREVKLVGEAFFSVAKDEKKFIVGTLNNSKIVVHGTEFNVEFIIQAKLGCVVTVYRRAHCCQRGLRVVRGAPADVEYHIEITGLHVIAVGLLLLAVDV